MTCRSVWVWRTSFAQSSGRSPLLPAPGLQTAGDKEVAHLHHALVDSSPRAGPDSWNHSCSPQPHLGACDVTGESKLFSTAKLAENPLPLNGSIQ